MTASFLIFRKKPPKAQSSRRTVIHPTVGGLVMRPRSAPVFSCHRRFDDTPDSKRGMLWEEIRLETVSGRHAFASDGE